jgi:hypothetical protein
MKILDQYVTEHVEKGIFSATPSGFTCPNDSGIKSRWIEIVFDLCARKHRDMSSDESNLFIYCELVVGKSAGDFTFDNVSQIIRDQIIEDFKKDTEDIDDWPEETQLEYLGEVLNSCLLTQRDIIVAMAVMSQLVVERNEILPNFIDFIELAVCGIDNVNDEEDIQRLRGVVQVINGFLYTKEFDHDRWRIREYAKLLAKKYLNSHPKFDLHLEKHPTADKSFVEVVEKVVNQNIHYDTEYAFENPKANAEFYLDNATKSIQRSKSFILSIMHIFHEKEIAQKFFKLIVSLCMEKFMKQHNDSKRDEYTDEEVHATNRFICELAVKKIFPTQGIDEMLEILKTVTSPRSQSCVALISMTRTCCQLGMTDGL